MERMYQKLYITIGCPPIISIIEIISYIKNPDFPEDDLERTIKDPHYQYAIRNLELLLFNHFNGKYTKKSEEYNEFLEILISHQLFYMVDKAISIMTMEMPEVKLAIVSIKIIDLNGIVGVCYY